jgi:hypothetical protein
MGCYWENIGEHVENPLGTTKNPKNPTPLHPIPQGKKKNWVP